MNNKKISLSILIMTLIFIVSCNTNVSNYEYDNLVGHTFYLTKKTDTGLIIYNSCWAKVSKVKFYPNKFYYDPGQEPYFYKIVNFIKNKELITLQAHIFETENKELLENYSIKLVDSSRYYIYFNNEIFIDSLKKNSIPNIAQPCIECYEKEECDEWVRQEKEKKERPFYIKQWQGTYSFDFGGTHMGENFEGSVTFKIDNESSNVNFKTNKKILEIINATKDTLKLQNTEGDIYKIYKDEQGYFNASGHKIYMLSPPNESYLLTKEK